jgi:hypothetical protein
MSDFDAVLERLLVDPAFKVALARDPSAALAGYRLSADELELLGAQLSMGDGEARTVETRSSKSSMFGLLGSLEGLAAGGAGGGHPAGEGFSPEWRQGTGGGHPGSSPLSGLGERLGPALNAPGAAEGGPVELPGAGEAVWPAGAGAGEAAWPTGEAAWPTGAGAGEPLMPTGAGGAALPGGGHIPVGYHPHVDADGDGRWDHYVAVQRADGGVDIYEDRNHDGLVDFVGHDRNADGIIDSADYDENFDGIADTHMTDLNGDGWMDTRTAIPAPGEGGAG